MIEILLVEDNPADAKLTVAAFQQLHVANHVVVAKDGDEALAFLFQKGVHGAAPRPSLILLDLNLPGKSGHEVLSEIKSNENLKTIPVLILSSSDDPGDIARTYQNHANCYITKPADLNGLFAIVESIAGFWFTSAKLPDFQYRL